MSISVVSFLFQPKEGEDPGRWIANTIVMASKDAGVVARAYEATDGKEPTHLLLLEAGETPILSSELGSHLKEADVFASKDQRNYVLLSDSGTSKEVTSYLAYAAITPGDGQVEEFHNWYNEEHLQHVKDIPGWQRSIRASLASSTVSGTGEAVVQDTAPDFVAIYEFDQKPDFASPVIQRNMGNPRSVKNMGGAKLVEVRVFKALDV